MDRGTIFESTRESMLAVAAAQNGKGVSIKKMIVLAIDPLDQSWSHLVGALKRSGAPSIPRMGANPGPNVRDAIIACVNRDHFRRGFVSSARVAGVIADDPKPGHVWIAVCADHGISVYQIEIALLN